jgi:hypothetical protein
MKRIDIIRAYGGLIVDIGNCDIVIAQFWLLFVNYRMGMQCDERTQSWCWYAKFFQWDWDEGSNRSVGNTKKVQVFVF